MESYGIRELQRRPSEILGQVEKTGRPALVTRYGKLAAILMPIDPGASRTTCSRAPPIS